MLNLYEDAKLSHGEFCSSPSLLAYPRVCALSNSISELEHVCNPRYQPGVSREPGEGQGVNHQRKLEFSLY